MNEYIFYTTEGQTLAPNVDYTIENCQVLGFAKGDNIVTMCCSLTRLRNLYKMRKRKVRFPMMLQMIQL